MGCMVRTSKNLRWTCGNQQDTIEAQLQVNDMNPPQQMCTAIDNKMFCSAALVDPNEETIYTDLAGRFPVRFYIGM